MSWFVNSRENLPKGDNPLGTKFYGYTRTGLTLPDGRSATYYGVDVGDCVHVVGLEDDLTTYLVRQHRPNLLHAGMTEIPVTLELPGGFATAGLSLTMSAQKELTEETGRVAGTLQQVGALYPSTGISNEVDTIFMGTDLEAVAAQGGAEATEQDMRVIAMPFGQAYDLLLSGQHPVAAQTLAAMAMVAVKL